MLYDENYDIKGEFSCIICDMSKGIKVSFKSQQELQEHTREHGSCMPKAKPTTAIAKCDYCTEMFMTINDIVKHIYKEHPDKKTGYFCSFCGKYFPLESSRNIHIQFEHRKMKKGNETHQCDCGVSFYNQSAIEFHYKSFHERRDRILISDIVTMPPSNKIMKINTGEICSVYYCHLCGHEYVLKGNLRCHVENYHEDLKHHTTPEQLIKCLVCCALFFNQLAYNAHKMYHKPDDQYVTSEQERIRIVDRVDNDFDPLRIPTIWDSQNVKKSRILKLESYDETVVKTEAMEEEQIKENNDQLYQSPTKPSKTGNFTKKRRNKALVDSDAEVKSDSSDDSSDDEKIGGEALYALKQSNLIKNKTFKIKNLSVRLKKLPKVSIKKEVIKIKEKQSAILQCVEITPVIINKKKSSIKKPPKRLNKAVGGITEKDEFTACDKADGRKKKKPAQNFQVKDKKPFQRKPKVKEVSVSVMESDKPRRSIRNMKKK